MIDLKITDSGDINFLDDIQQNQKCNISFYVAKYMPQRISFTCIPNEFIGKNEKNGLSITFQSRDVNIYTDQADVVQDLDESMQNLYIRLKTELGEVTYNQSFGSELWKTRHETYYGKNESGVLARIMDIVKAELVKCIDSADINNIDVKISYLNGSGHFACQTVKINIDIHGYKEISFVL